MDKINLLEELDSVLLELEQLYSRDRSFAESHFSRAKETKQKINIYQYIRNMIIGDEEIPMCSSCGRVWIEGKWKGDDKICTWCGEEN